MKYIDGMGPCALTFFDGDHPPILLWTAPAEATDSMQEYHKRNSFSIRHGSRLSSGKTHDKGICRIPGRGGFDGPPPERPLLFVQPPFPCLFPVFPIRRRHASQDSNPAKRGIFFLQSDFPKMLREAVRLLPNDGGGIYRKEFPSSGEKGKTDKWSEPPASPLASPEYRGEV